MSRAMNSRAYISIDLKSFYASVECKDRGLDPLMTNLVVADASRSEKTICLAVSPPLKAYGVPGRPRLFEVVQKVREINAARLRKAPDHVFSGKSWDYTELEASPRLALDYLVATPRMARYVEYSTRVYHVYLKYIAPEDIHVYSIDEVMIDATNYLNIYHMTARELASQMILDVFNTVGITATAGIGSNLYLSKVAMDILAKHIPPDKNGIRVAELDEEGYRRELWSHRPLTDFWRVGRGYAQKLEQRGIFTMGDIARCSLGGSRDYPNEDLLYKLFGVNAELLIDHAWGWEPCTMADVKAYTPGSKSIASGQVLHCAYPREKARLIVREMTDLLSLDLVDKKLVCDQLVLTLGYDADNLKDPVLREAYEGNISLDHYGRETPGHAHGTANMPKPTSSSRLMLEAVTALFDRIADPGLMVRRVNIAACRVIGETSAPAECSARQLDFFTDYAAERLRKEVETASLARERKMQQTILDIKKKIGRNAVFKGMSLKEGATGLERNRQIGGHRA